MRKLWTIRILSAVLCVSILILIFYRISIWYTQNRINFQSNANENTNESSSSSSAWSSSQILITLCNLNPIRGDRIYQLPNGSKLYDEFVDKWHKATISYRDDSNYLLPKSILVNASHNLENMLKWCYLGLKNCNSNYFNKVWYHNRFCDQIVLHKMDTSLTLALDPEEKHYVIPGYGFIGFKLCISNIVQRNAKQLSYECFYISNKLHTIIGVTRSVIGDDSLCDLRIFDECRSKCIEYSALNCSCNKYLKYCHFSYHISTNLQAAPSPFFSHLFKMQSNKQNYSMCDNLIPSLIQWRAVLKFVNPELFLQMVKLSNGLRTIQSRQTQLFSFIRKLQHHISSDLTRLKHIRDDSNLCDLPNLLDQLNRTCNLFDDNFFENNYSLSKCKSKLHISGYFELAVIELMFSHKEISFRDHLFKQKMNQLSLLNLEFKTRTSPVNCFNSIIQKMGEFYSQEIIFSSSSLADYSLSCHNLQSGLVTLRNTSADIISSILHKKHTNRDKRTLVTVTIDILTNPRQISPQPIYYKQNVIPLTVISELIDIICSSAAVAALFIFIIKCLRSPRIKSRTKPRKRINSSIRLHRASGTTQTEIMREDDIIISPVTFTL